MIKKNLKYKFGVNALTYAVLVCIILNIFFGLIPYDKYVIASGIKNTLRHRIVYIYLWSLICFIPLYPVMWNRFLLRFVSLIIFCLYLFYSYYAYISVQPSFRLDSVTMAFILDTNIQEASELLVGIAGLKKFLFCYALFPFIFILFCPISSCNRAYITKQWKIICKICGVLYEKCVKLVQKSKYKEEIYFCLILTILIVSFYYANTKEIVYKENPLLNISSILGETIKSRYGKKHVEDNQYYFQQTEEKNKDLIIVLMWGESSRADHWSLNGYNRETNPRLGRIKNLINFRDAHSCRMSTNLSFSCMITGYNDKEKYDVYPPKETMISFFKKAGYQINFLSAGANDLNEFIKEDMQNIRIKMNKTTFSNNYAKTYDADLIDMLKQVTEKNNSKPQFILMTSMGSHHNYEKRVPKKFRVFKSENKGILINSDGAYCNLHNNGLYLNDIVDAYDNTIYYTDFVIDGIINQLKDKNALFLYASDHGESFGERGQPCLHGYNTPEVWEIPFLIWASDKYIANNRNKWDDLIKTQQETVSHNGRMVSHDNIVHTLLDGASIESNFLDKSMSLFNQREPINKNIFEGCKRFKVFHPVCDTYETSEK
ncbi:MAG: sulfatase-like hydrolase/transferase [Alphaproteobacteria bacterium]|nr:sulfatase-like hydrolase/transferase [Alphaproteobacteria bacterium]